MHRKLKNNLISLAAVAVLLGAGALFGEPLSLNRSAQEPGSESPWATASAGPESSTSIPGTATQAQPADPATAPTAQSPRLARLRLHLVMPYYSFARLLPRPVES